MTDLANQRNRVRVHAMRYPTRLMASIVGLTMAAVFGVGAISGMGQLILLIIKDVSQTSMGSLGYVEAIGRHVLVRLQDPQTWRALADVGLLSVGIWLVVGRAPASVRAAIGRNVR